MRRLFSGFLVVLLLFIGTLPVSAMTLDSSVCYPYNSKDGSTMAIGVMVSLMGICLYMSRLFNQLVPIAGC